MTIQGHQKAKTSGESAKGFQDGCHGSQIGWRRELKIDRHRPQCTTILPSKNHKPPSSGIHVRARQRKSLRQDAWRDRQTPRRKGWKHYGPDRLFQGRGHKNHFVRLFLFSVQINNFSLMGTNLVDFVSRKHHTKFGVNLVSSFRDDAWRNC